MSFNSWWTQYYPPSPSFTESSVPSQKGRVFIVTGGSTGVGFELCKILYTTGATVYMTSRSKERAVEAIKQIVTNLPIPEHPGKLHYLLLDLADLESVKVFAASFQRVEKRLDVLWHNAGSGAMQIPKRSKSKQGLEAFVGMHCVAPLLLTKLLMPQLHAAAQAPGSEVPRVVWTTSHLDRLAPAEGIDFSVLEQGGAENPLVNYGTSKLGNWLLAHELAKRHPEFISVVQNPGNLDTAAYNGSPRALMWLLRWFVLHEVRYGAYTELFAGLSPEVTKNRTGSYIIPWGRFADETAVVRKDIMQALDDEDADGGQGISEQFWNWCESQYKAFV